jgi:hypothetical protein
MFMQATLPEYRNARAWYGEAMAVRTFREVAF